MHSPALKQPQLIGKLNGACSTFSVKDFEGELRRIKSFLSSRKDIYKLKGHMLMIRKVSK